MPSCPCGLPKPYEQCCRPYILEKDFAPTAEALMRSRYSAYVMGQIQYIAKTHLETGQDDFDVEAARKWSEESDWKGLEIVQVEKGGPKDEEGVVEFMASYISEGVLHKHHERSHFIKADGKWLYKEGDIVTASPVRRSQPKVGRNDPCPCGSGKKYKKCCG